jgi:hypothetical protein
MASNNLSLSKLGLVECSNQECLSNTSKELDTASKSCLHQLRLQVNLPANLYRWTISRNSTKDSIPQGSWSHLLQTSLVESEDQELQVVVILLGVGL